MRHLTIGKEVRELVREYYSHHGEKVRVMEKLQRKVYDDYTESAYLCRVGEKERIIYTLIDADNHDAHGNRYATEITASCCMDNLVDQWVNEFNPESEYFWENMAEENYD